MAMDFKNLQFLSRGLCRHTVLLLVQNFAEIRKLVDELWQKSDFQDGGRRHPPPSWTLKKFNFWSRHYSICYSVPNFIKIGRLFTEIWRFNDFRNGGRLPSWILKMCRFCHLALADMPFCFLIQNIAEVGQSVDELWPKSDFQDDCNRVQYLM